MKKILLLLAIVLIAGCASNDDIDRGPMMGGQYPQDYNPNSRMGSSEYFGLYLPENEQVGNIAAIKIQDDKNIIITDRKGESKRLNFSWDVTGTVIHIDTPEQNTITFWIGKDLIKDTTTGHSYYKQTK